MKAIIAIMVAASVAMSSGCVSTKVVEAVSECNAAQIAQKSMRYQAMMGKMDAKDVTINVLAEALAGDPCAAMMTAEINGKNRLANSALLGGFAALPYIATWRNADQNSHSQSEVTVNATTGNAGNGGGEGSLGGNSGMIEVNVSGGQTNTGSQQTFDKGILGGTGSISDPDTVNNSLLD